MRALTAYDSIVNTIFQNITAETVSVTALNPPDQGVAVRAIHHTLFIQSSWYYDRFSKSALSV